MKYYDLFEFCWSLLQKLFEGVASFFHLDLLLMNNCNITCQCKTSTVLILLCFLNSRVEAEAYNIPPAIRFTLERSEADSPIIYYFSKPHAETYPILVLCDGSEQKGNLRSVFHIREFFSQRIEDLNVGYLTLEKWGIDGEQSNEEDFYKHYSRTQRLEDHLSVIRFLEEYPPRGWDGKLIFIGVSEGGPLVTDLTILCENVLATVNWVGAGDWGWADEFWEFFQHWKRESFLMRLYDAIPRWFPFSSDIPQTRREFDAIVRYILDHPNADQWLGGMTYFYHADAFRTSPIDYTKITSPFLVVMGIEDSNITSCDQFVQKAVEAGAPITYFRIEGMDHYIRKQPDVIDQSFHWLALTKRKNEN